ncbi:MAG: winged helix-turn-helix transcriptional regulator [Asgard group archaeon]|nr:winged helix-turn-helix transcriptional regulator [Asgard group archaeon]
MSYDNLSMEDSLQITKAIKNETKHTILVYLLIYNELTLDQLSELLKKSKSTIHHHMQQLLDLKLVGEETKPGSKTIFYKIQMYRSDIALDKAYSVENVTSLPLDIQNERLNDLLEHNYAFTLIMQNIIKLNFERINQIKKDYEETKEPLSVWEKAQDKFMSIYLASPRYADEFKSELKQLVSKYFKMETVYEDDVRPTAFMILGLNVKDILDRKINQK